VAVTSVNFVEGPEFDRYPAKPEVQSPAGEELKDLGNCDITL